MMGGLSPRMRPVEIIIKGNCALYIHNILSWLLGLSTGSVRGESHRKKWMGSDPGLCAVAHSAAEPPSMCTYVYECMCMCLCAYSYTWTYVPSHIQVPCHLLCVRMYLCVYVCVYMCACDYKHMHGPTCRRTFSFRAAINSKCVCVCLKSYILVSICIYVFFILLICLYLIDTHVCVYMCVYTQRTRERAKEREQRRER